MLLNISNKSQSRLRNNLIQLNPHKMYNMWFYTQNDDRFFFIKKENWIKEKVEESRMRRYVFNKTAIGAFCFYEIAIQLVY